MKTLALFILATAISISACADPSSNKPKAVTTEPTANSPMHSEVSKTDTLLKMNAKGSALPIDLESSKVEFTGSKVTGQHEGGFKTFQGIIDLVGDKPENSSVVFELDMSSVFTDADGLTKHLKTGDFFEIEKFPKSTFISATIVRDSEKDSGNFIVTGDLEIRGVKKSITFPATIDIKATNVSVSAEFSINRKDFGIVYAGKADDLIRDDVVIKLDLVAPKK